MGEKYETNEEEIVIKNANQKLVRKKHFIRK